MMPQRVWIMELPGGDMEVWLTQDLARARRKALREREPGLKAPIHPRFIRNASWLAPKETTP